MKKRLFVLLVVLLIAIPLINAGDGIGEHPTQALLDYVTVRKEQGRVDGLTVTMLGDMKHGRTVHSLARLLSLYNVKLNYVSPEILRMPSEIIEELGARGVEQSEYEDLAELVSTVENLEKTRKTSQLPSECHLRKHSFVQL